jgi:hypothetical protein
MSEKDRFEQEIHYRIAKIISLSNQRDVMGKAFEVQQASDTMQALMKEIVHIAKSRELAAYKRMAEEVKLSFEAPWEEMHNLTVDQIVDKVLERLSKEVGK